MMMRKFEKISFEQFKKDVADDANLYASYELPKRKTKHSAGYDLASLKAMVLKPGESFLVPTGVKCISPPDEIFLVAMRSSIGFKNNIGLPHGIGIVDADYYNNAENEGHIYIGIRNNGTENFEIKVGDRIGQGVFIKYYCIDDEAEIMEERKGGYGSTNNGE